MIKKFTVVYFNERTGNYREIVSKGLSLESVTEAETAAVEMFRKAGVMVRLHEVKPFKK